MGYDSHLASLGTILDLRVSRRSRVPIGFLADAYLLAQYSSRAALHMVPTYVIEADA